MITTGTATAISVGDFHNCAIQAGTGKIFCWGYNKWGQATPPGPICDNGFDDDGNGLIDYPADPGCTSPTDDIEYDHPGAHALSAASLRIEMVPTNGGCSWWSCPVLWPPIPLTWNGTGSAT